MRLPGHTNSLKELSGLFLEMYDKTTVRDLKVRRISIGLGNLLDESNIEADMFTDVKAVRREHSLLCAIVDIKEKYGKNAIVKGSAFEEKSTERARNLMVGGHSQ